MSTKIGAILALIVDRLRTAEPAADSAIVTAEDLAETLNESRGKFVNDEKLR